MRYIQPAKTRDLESDASAASPPETVRYLLSKPNAFNLNRASGPGLLFVNPVPVAAIDETFLDLSTKVFDCSGD